MVMTRIAALLTAAVSAGCSTVTGGTPATPHTSAPVSVTAAAPSNSPAAPPPPTTPSPEDQIRQTLFAFQDAANSQNWEAYTELMCAAMRAQFTGTVLDYLKKDRAQTGLTTIKDIVSIDITGDTASVTMDNQNEALGSRRVTMRLKYEDGWKICML
jgi:hypothetical protein